MLMLGNRSFFQQCTIVYSYYFEICELCSSFECLARFHCISMQQSCFIASSSLLVCDPKCFFVSVKLLDGFPSSSCVFRRSGSHETIDIQRISDVYKLDLATDVSMSCLQLFIYLNYLEVNSCRVQIKHDSNLMFSVSYIFVYPAQDVVSRQFL